jgi:hypothetical protein
VLFPLHLTLSYRFRSVKAAYRAVAPSSTLKPRQIQHDIEQLVFLTSWNRDYPLLIEQLIHFPLAAHDDGPDALAGAVSFGYRNH